MNIKRELSATIVGWNLSPSITPSSPASFNGTSLKYLFIVANEDDLLIVLEDWINDRFNFYKVPRINLTRLGNYPINVHVKDWTNEIIQEIKFTLTATAF